MPAPPVWLSLVIRPRSHFRPTFFPSPRSARSRRRIQACSWGISFWVCCSRRSSEALPAPLKPHPGSQPTCLWLLFLPHPFTRARSELRPCSASSSPPASPLIQFPAGPPGPAAGKRRWSGVRAVPGAALASANSRSCSPRAQHGAVFAQLRGFCFPPLASTRRGLGFTRGSLPVRVRLGSRSNRWRPPVRGHQGPQTSPVEPREEWTAAEMPWGPQEPPLVCI